MSQLSNVYSKMQEVLLLRNTIPKGEVKYLKEKMDQLLVVVGKKG